jgi:hypothetical protein
MLTANAIRRRNRDPLVNEIKLPATNVWPNASVNSGSHAQHHFGCSLFTLLLYVSFCLALAAVAYRRPLPTYDRFLYAGAVASLRYSDPLMLYHIARTEFDSEPSPFNFDSVAAEPYFTDVYANPNHFAQQLGPFRIKLGYVAAGYALWRAGLPILVSLRLISACCLFIVGLAVLAWSHDALLSAVLLLTPPVLNMGRMVTADPLSSTLIVLALFTLAKKKYLLAMSLLIACVLVRADNFLLLLILLAGMIWKRHLRLAVAAFYAVLAVLIAAIVNQIAAMFSWRVLMQHTFIKPEIDPVTHPVPITFAGYLHALVGLRAIPYTFMTVWILVAAAVWRRMPEGSFFRDLLPVIGIYAIVRLLVFPNFDDRVFVWAYLLAGVALIQMAQPPISDSRVSANF